MRLWLICSSSDTILGLVTAPESTSQLLLPCRHMQDVASALLIASCLFTVFGPLDACLVFESSYFLLVSLSF